MAVAARVYYSTGFGLCLFPRNGDPRHLPAVSPFLTSLWFQCFPVRGNSTRKFRRSVRIVSPARGNMGTTRRLGRGRY